MLGGGGIPNKVYLGGDRWHGPHFWLARITETKSMNLDNLMGVFGEIDATTDIFLLYSENVWSAVYPKLPYFKLSAADVSILE